MSLSLSPRQALYIYMRSKIWCIALTISLCISQLAAAQAFSAPVLIAKPVHMVMQEDITVTGTLLANEQVKVSPEIAGIVKAISFDEGGRVKNKVLLLELDDSLFAAEFKQAKASHTLAQTRHDRVAKLLKSHSISQAAYDESIAELQERRAALDVANVKLSKTRITAPFDGYVTFRNLSVGAYVKPGDHLVTVVDDTPLKLQFRLPERLARIVKPNTEIHFEVSSDGTARHFKATVVATEPVISPNSRTVLARALFANDNREVIAGAFAKIQLSLGSAEPAITVPTEAIIGTRTGHRLFIVNDGMAEARMIVTGVRKNGRITILKGLSGDENVVIAGHQLIGDGSPVTVRNDG